MAGHDGEPQHDRHRGRDHAGDGGDKDGKLTIARDDRGLRPGQHRRDGIGIGKPDRECGRRGGRNRHPENMAPVGAGAFDDHL